MKIASIQPLPPVINDQIPILPRGLVIGGAETASHKFTEILSKKGHDVYFFIGKYPGIEREKIRLNENFLVEYVKIYNNNSNIKVFSPTLLLKLLFGNYDLIISHQIPTFFSLTGSIIATLLREKSIVFYHGLTPRTNIELMIAKLVCLLAKKVIVQNEFAYNTVKNYTLKNNIQLIPNGVDTSFFYKRDLSKEFVKKYNPDNQPIILYSGRLIPAKGVDVLLLAYSKLRLKKMPKVLIVGEGNYADELKAYAKKLKIENNVSFVGFISQNELPLFYSVADVAVLPSTSYDMKGKYIPNVNEIFPMVLIEAMACGTPVVAANFGGTPSFITNGVNGLLFKERDSEELAEQLKTILTDNKYRKMLVDNAHKDIVNKYSLDIVYKKFIDLK